MTQTLASNRVLSGSSSSVVSVNFYHDRPWLPRQRIFFWNLDDKWLQTGSYNSYVLDSCIKRGFLGLEVACCHSDFIPTNPGCHGNEIWNNWTETCKVRLGTQLRGVAGQNSARSNVTCPEHSYISLHSTHSGDLGWVNLRAYKLFASRPNFIHFFFAERRRAIN